MINVESCAENGKEGCMPGGFVGSGQVNGSSGNTVFHAIVTRERDLRNDMYGRFFHERNDCRQQGFRSLR